MTSMPPPDDPSAPPTPAPEPQSPPPAQYVTTPQSAAPTSYAGAPPRPGMVTAAGVVMIIFGALLSLLGVFALIGGAFISGSGSSLDSQFPGMGGVTAGAVGGVIIVFALIFLALGILDILAGANVFGGRGWARITGIVLAAIFAVISLLGIGGSSQNGGIIVTLLIIAGNVFIIWALATTGSWFGARAAAR